MTEQPKSLDEALAAFQADPPTLTKDKSGQVGNQKTKYADLVQVNRVVLKKLNELGVIYVCAPTLQEDGKLVLEYELRHVASGTARQGRYPLKLSENPQQMGSAITYARRYVLLSLTGVAAEDEDDDGRGGNSRPTAQRANQPQVSRQTAQRQSSGAPPLPGEQNLITQPQMAKMQALFAEQGFATPGDKKTFLERVVGHLLASTKDLTKAEAAAVIDRLEKRDELGEVADV